VFRLVVALLAVGLALSTTRPSPKLPPLALAVRPVPLNPEDPAQTRVGRLLYRGGVELRSLDRRFGGLSDLRVLDNGRRLVAISDCGTALLAELRYDESRNLTGVVGARLRPLLAPGGRPLRPEEVDAESLALAPDGALIVGFEQRHRLWRYPPGGGPFELPPDPLQAPAGGAALEPNRGFEAALSLEDGRLVVLTESPRGQPRTAAGWIERGAVWEEFDLPLFYAEDVPGEPFRPTGLARLPGGDVLVLERRFPPAGVRLLRLARGGLETGRDLTVGELARLGPPLTTDNFEGVDASPGPDGEERVYLISDDNDCDKADHRHGTSSQRTLLLAFSLAD
jgi:hypothetical protein